MSQRAFSRRVYVLAGTLALWSIAIGGRLYHLQIVQSADLRLRAERQQQRSIEVSPKRGVIYDRHGRELAISVKVDSVFAVPDEIEDPAGAAVSLARLTSTPRADLEQRLRSGKSFVWIKRKISAAESEAVRKAKIPGVYFQKEDRRFYPKRESAAHVLGYVNVDEDGMGGIEYQYNDLVRGVPGRVVFMSDARGRSFQTVEQAPAPGASVTTTIDENIQFIIEKELADTIDRSRAAGMSIIAMDPKDGGILGMASYPGFDPNRYAEFPATSWINRSIHQVYEPGSTFKIATTVGALEEGLTTPDEVIDCQMGSIVLYGHRIRDHKPFGLLTVRQAMQYSSDVGMIKLGLRLGDERFSGYISKLGFGRSTRVDLPGEERGLVKPASRWSRVSVGAISMGQEIGVTPLQIVRMVSAVANGGILYKPHVVKRVEHPTRGVLQETEVSGERVMSPETALQLQDMLEVVVTEGTAKSSRLDGYRAAGKTGTAQKIDPATRAYSKTKYIASFAGYAPASNPAISLIVVIDEPVGLYHGGDIAAPVFKRVAEQILRYLAVPSDVTTGTPRYIIGAPRAPAPVSAGEDTEGTANNQWHLIAARLDEESASAPAATVDPLALQVTVPDFSGQSVRQVANTSLQLNLRLIAEGTGLGRAQHPAPGALVPEGTPVRVRFRTRE